MPAGEFWVNGHRKAENGYNADTWQRLNLKQTAAAAHIYGKREAMAEAFTMMDGDATHWALGPADLKPYANDAFCEGINRFMLHQATCQPPSDGMPGFEFCAGQHFTPNLTWWEQSPAFFSYLSRCQYMLQQGYFVADVCFYLGEQPPTLAPPKYLVPTLGPGYDCDYTNAEVLLNRMSVKNGRIVLPDGMSYRLLVLQNCTSPDQNICNKVSAYQRLQVSSEPSTAMSMEVLLKIQELILAGATVVGPPPESSFGLFGYPEKDVRLRQLVKEIWGNLDGKTFTERNLGKGRIIWGKTPREILLADGIIPDFSFPEQQTDPGQVDYIHRALPDLDIYFVCNRTNQNLSRKFTFRVAGKQPEIWNALTGESYPVEAQNQTTASTTLSLYMDKFSAFFIVFRKSSDANSSQSKNTTVATIQEATELSGPWNVSFDPHWGGPELVIFPKLISWTDHTEDGIKYYSGKATYKKAFDWIPITEKKQNTLVSKKRCFLDLGNLEGVAEVRLNGKRLGVLWCYPWRIEITDVVKPTGNQLEVDVVNLWANRVIGDLNLPKENRITRTHEDFRFDFLTGQTPLLTSGLLGPVLLIQY
jgi:hypothetical protein